MQINLFLRHERTYPSDLISRHLCMSVTLVNSSVDAAFPNQRLRTLLRPLALSSRSQTGNVQALSIVNNLLFIKHSTFYSCAV
jgi:hypothetical protein